MNFTPLIELTRGGTPECLHFGAIAVVNSHGHLLAHAGNPHWLSFTRSTLKALQALPFMEAGGPQRLGFNTRQVALLCASHNGEASHVAEVQGMLEACGQTYRALRCGCHVPYVFTTLETTPPANFVADERHHNCSGKHTGFLAHCVLHGMDTATYTEPAHPLQVAVRTAVARVAGLPSEALALGIDGCSAPNYAMPLSRLACAYARLASGAQDPEFGSSFAQLSDAMTAHPDMVSGTGRSDLALMQAGRGDWVTKVGADGVQAVASKSRGEGFAIKISDANKPALFAATVETLEQLGWLDDAQRAELEPWRAATLHNLRGTPVGERRSVFKLNGAKTPVNG